MSLSKKQIKSVSRDKLFFGQYNYSLCIRLEEAPMLNSRTHQELDDRIRWRAESIYRSRMLPEFVKKNLHTALTLINQHRDCVKITTSWNVMYVYASDLNILDQFSKLPGASVQYAQQAVVDRPLDVVLLKDPKWKYRSYLREGFLNDSEPEILKKFLDSRKDQFGITKWFDTKLGPTAPANGFRYGVWLNRQNFIDHDDPKDLLMLALAIPGIVRKTVPIQAK